MNGKWMARVMGVLMAAALTACSTSGGDAAITGKIRTVLQADREVDASRIQVSTERGVVTLDGSVAGEDAHKKALTLAQSVPGVRQVRDRLTVTPAPPAPADDAVPAAPAGATGSPALGGILAEGHGRRAPADQPGGSYGLLAAVVGPQGDVSLEAAESVEPALEPAARRDSPASAERPGGAMDLSAARGDEAIATSLPPSGALLGPADDEDAAITARVREALAEVSRRVQVMTRAGVVTLSGAVDTEWEKSEALRVARETKGVSRVEDRVIVLTS